MLTTSNLLTLLSSPSSPYPPSRTPPDEYTSPVDHGWAVDQGWSAEDIAEAAGRQLEVPSYFMPHDEQKQAEAVPVGSHCGGGWGGGGGRGGAVWGAGGGWESCVCAFVRPFALSHTCTHVHTYTLSLSPHLPLMPQGYGTGEMYWRSSRSEPLEDYVDDPLEDPAAEQMKRRQAEVDAAAADLLRGL